MVTADQRELLRAAQSWMDQDPDPQTAAETRLLLDAAGAGDDDALGRLADQFGARLEFGTAGLRGAIAAGPNRMNRLVVAQTAAGVAAYLRDREADGRPVVVIGWDGRRNSELFARESAEILAGAGIVTLLMPHLTPTPLLAFAVRHLGASAGIMVTASHNPPGDNGYKVYLGGEDGGSQIVPPADRQIADSIESIAAATPWNRLPRSDQYQIVDSAVLRAYADAAAGVRVGSHHDEPPTTVHTALHGVGWATVQSVLRKAGFPALHPVDAQATPDAAFPTVDFPNPEEPGALDLALEQARAIGAGLVLANDPDADRLAVAVADRRDPTGFRLLTGNEVGQLLGWRAAELAHAQGRTGSLAVSIVSSPALGQVAQEYGLDYVETATGFKWISRAKDLVYGYEEALGYLVDPDSVRDKDGISALVAVLDLAATLAGSGRTLLDRLDELGEKFGVHGSRQVAGRFASIDDARAIMAMLRRQPPEAIGGVPVQRIEDLSLPGAGAVRTDALRMSFDHARIMVRPSGTEPKIKFYIDAWSADGTLADRAEFMNSLVERLAAGVRQLAAV